MNAEDILYDMTNVAFSGFTWKVKFTDYKEEFLRHYDIFKELIKIKYPDAEFNICVINKYNTIVMDMNETTAKNTLHNYLNKNHKLALPWWIYNKFMEMTFIENKEFKYIMTSKSKTHVNEDVKIFEFFQLLPDKQNIIYVNISLH